LHATFIYAATLDQRSLSRPPSASVRAVAASSVPLQIAAFSGD